MRVEVELASLAEIQKRRGLEPGGTVQQYVDSEVLRLCDPYIPKYQGSLIVSGQTGTKVGSGEVVWNSPYARFLYFGKLMVSKTGSAWAKLGEKKKVTNKDLTYTGAPRRGKLWFQRMKADHGGEIVAGARRKAGMK